jgi:hypothetical protein
VPPVPIGRYDDILIESHEEILKAPGGNKLRPAPGTTTVDAKTLRMRARFERHLD